MKRRASLTVMVLLFGLILGDIFQPFTGLQSFAQGGCRAFPETGKQVCGRFLEYWQANGGLAQQGLPLTGEFQERSDLNGQTYTVQYFERAVFEKHPENARPFDVLLSQLGTFQFRSKYPNGDPSSGQPAPTQPPAPPPAGQEFQLVGAINSFVNILDDTIYVGVLKYNGTTVRASPKVVATFTDSGGRVLGTDSYSSNKRLLQPGEIIPFKLRYDGLAPEGVRVDLTVEARTASDFDRRNAASNLQVEQSTLTAPGNDRDEAKVVGRIKNGGTQVAWLVSITAVFYDAAGKVIDVDNGYTSLDELAPGATSPFEISSYDAKGVARYELVVSGSVKN